MIIYVMGVNGGATYINSHNYSRINVDSKDFLLLEKTITFHNVIILIRDKDNYHYNVFLEKYSYELPKKISFCIKYK